jgi:hypothetical protein
MVAVYGEFDRAEKRCAQSTTPNGGPMTETEIEDTLGNIRGAGKHA